MMLCRIVGATLASASMILAGCGSPSDMRGDASVGRGFGEPCEHTDECASGLCLATGPSSAVCTRVCTSHVECPEGPSWGCVQPEHFEARVCGCAADSDEEICGDGRDNDCDGRTDDCRLCDGVPVPEDDPRHCGACGVRCSADQRCWQGACVCRDGDALNCDGACIDPRTSAFHCGGCRRACEDARECVDGVCGCPEERPDACRVQGCVDFQTDRMNCGGCDQRCPLNQECEGGACGCPGGLSYCGTSCIDTRTSLTNCGACGNACPSGTMCTGGECTCPTGQRLCGGRCVDTLNDPAHCGACGNTCPSTTSCISGTCRCPRADHTLCDGVCVATSIDPSHCGACGNTCPLGSRCISGSCHCDGDLCGGQCIRTTSDPSNCGGCGNTCRPGESCASGACRCPSGVYCGELCMPANDAGNCGACGNVCGTAQSCSAGTCRCNTSSLTACGTSCVDTRTNAANCGACGHACRPGEVCSGSTCSCPTGQTFCESAGRCVDTRVDAEHCGGCGVTCRATEVCGASTCRCPLSTEAWCDGSCIDVASDRDNCGSCGNTCAAEASCVSRACRCPVASQTSCGSDGCRDLGADPQHCGACGRACSGGQYCAAGTCLCPVASAGTPVAADFPVGTDLLRDSVFDGTRLAAVYAYPAEGFSEPTLAWVDTSGVVGSRYVDADLHFRDLIQRIRITPSAVGWNVLLRVERLDFPGPRHVLVRLASDGSRIAVVGLDSAAAPWAEADLAYVPGMGPVVTWITGTPATAFVRRLNEDGSNGGSQVVLGSVSGIPAIAHDGADELAVTVANGAPSPRLRTYFLSTGLSLLGTHDDTAAVAQQQRPHLAGRDGRWLVMMRTSTTQVRVLEGARLGAAATRAITRLQRFDWAEGELLVLSGGDDPYGLVGATRPALRRHTPDTSFTAIDAQLDFSTFRVGLGVARVSRTRALALLVGDELYGVEIELSDCPR